MKWMPLLLLWFACLLLSGCDDSSQYDTGYEAAWNDEDESSWFSSKEYREGHEQGVADAEMYDLGYYDGVNGHRPKHSKDPDYMDGFKDGKRNK